MRYVSRQKLNDILDLWQRIDSIAGVSVFVDILVDFDQHRIRLVLIEKNCVKLFSTSDNQLARYVFYKIEFIGKNLHERNSKVKAQVSTKVALKAIN